VEREGTLTAQIAPEKTSHGNVGVWKAWKAMKPAFHPSHTPWKSLRGFPHSHGYDCDYHVSEDRQSPPKTLNQSHSHRKGLVNHVPGLKRKGCPGTLRISDEEKEELRLLQQLAGGWVIWSDERGGRMFLPIEEWRAHLASWGRLQEHG
jgi:hypothetical protein